MPYVNWVNWRKLNPTTMQCKQMLLALLSAHMHCSSYSSFTAGEEKTTKLLNAANS